MLFCKGESVNQDPKHFADMVAYMDNQHYKLYRDGRFFDLMRDAEEERPLDPGQRTGEAATTARVLESALDQFQGARSEGPAAEPRRLPGNPIIRPGMLPASRALASPKSTRKLPP